MMKKINTPQHPLSTEITENVVKVFETTPYYDSDFECINNKKKLMRALKVNKLLMSRLTEEAY